MEKYGVEEFVAELKKQAEDGKLRCPLCGTEVLDAESPTPRCIQHGSAPFETLPRD
jgi:rubrerythrin